MRRAGLLVGLAFTVQPSIAPAQEATIALGTKVRIESTVERRLNGFLLARGADSLTVGRPSGLQTTVPVASVTRIRVRDGRSHRSGAAIGAKRGAIVGTSLVGALFLLSGQANKDDFEFMPLFVLVGAGYGAVMGGLIGAVVGAERWTTVYGRTVRASYRPLSNGRTSVGLRIH